MSHMMHGNMSAYSVLDRTLMDILKAINPSQEDWMKRVKLIEDLEVVVRSLENLRGATVEPFGSFVSNMFSRWGDLDISLMFTTGSHISFAGKKRKQAILEELLVALRRQGGWRRLRYIANARVPILKLEYGYPGISCDISIDNLQGQLKSKFLYWINAIDGRFRDMVLLVKQWTNAQNINNPKLGTFNSYSLSLLVLFHFQTCVPAILPPIRDIYPGNAVDDLIGVRSEAETYIEQTCRANIARYLSDKSRVINRSSLAELFTSFLAKFSDINLKAGTLGISPFTGRWENIKSNTRWLPRTYALFIEDPFEQPENTARSVSAGNLRRISQAFQAACQTTFSFSNQITLLCSLAGPEVSYLITGTPVGIPSGHYVNAYPQSSKAGNTHPGGQHRFSKGGGTDNSSLLNRTKVGSNGLTRKNQETRPVIPANQRQESHRNNSAKGQETRPAIPANQRQGHRNNSAKDESAHPQQSQGQQKWRPKSEKRSDIVKPNSGIHDIPSSSSS